MPVGARRQRQPPVRRGRSTSTCARPACPAPESAATVRGAIGCRAESGAALHLPPLRQVGHDSLYTYYRIAVKASAHMCPGAVCPVWHWLPRAGRFHPLGGGPPGRCRGMRARSARQRVWDPSCRSPAGRRCRSAIPTGAPLRRAACAPRRQVAPTQVENVDLNGGGPVMTLIVSTASCPLEWCLGGAWRGFARRCGPGRARRAAAHGKAGRARGVRRACAPRLHRSLAPQPPCDPAPPAAHACAGHHLRRRVGRGGGPV